MTTQTPYDPVPPQPDAVYPTAPPWAAPQQAPVAAPPPGTPVPPWAGGHVQHGQLMVPHPELLHAAGRAKPPSWVPVVVITALTLPFGAISAARRSRRARLQGNPGYPYWLAFVLAFGVAWTLSGIVGVVVGVPVYLNIRQHAMTKAVESRLVHDGKVRTTGGATVKRAACKPTSGEASGGRQAYTCSLTLSDGETATLRVVADSKGNWSAVKTR